MRTLLGGIMHQVIEGKSVYVVEFDTIPKLPITGLTVGEVYYRSLTAGSLLIRNPPTYAQALTDAIETGVIVAPGKYAIHLVPGTTDYEIYEIHEK
jgi:hypothetical protein